MAAHPDSATATLTPSPRRKKSSRKPLTMEEIQEQKTRERITAYRELVTRAASGEQLGDADMTTASDLLDALGLPPYTWARDVQAKRDDDAAALDESRYRDAEPDRQEREAELSSKVEAMEAELLTLRQELRNVATGEPMTLVNVLRRRNELRANHPHVLGDVEQAVAFRLQATRRAVPPLVASGSAQEGWSR